MSETKPGSGLTTQTNVVRFTINCGPVPPDTTSEVVARINDYLRAHDGRALADMMPFMTWIEARPIPGEPWDILPGWTVVTAPTFIPDQPDPRPAFPPISLGGPAMTDREVVGMVAKG